MRYDRQDAWEKEREGKSYGLQPEPPIGQFGELVIDEDTIYEIDETCLHCKDKKDRRR